MTELFDQTAAEMDFLASRIDVGFWSGLAVGLAIGAVTWWFFGLVIGLLAGGGSAVTAGLLFAVAMSPIDLAAARSDVPLWDDDRD